MFLTNAMNNVKYTVGALLSLAYMVYSTFLLKVNVASHAATMQLEDSDVTYATGMALANGTGSGLIFYVAVAVFIYCIVKLFLTTKESE